MPVRLQRGSCAGSPRISRRALVRAGVATSAVVAATGPGIVNPTKAGSQTPLPTQIVDATHESEWPAYGRDPGGMRHSPFTQITAANVSRIQVAWMYQTGELATYEGTDVGEKAAFEATPLMLDGTLYLSTPTNRVIALDAATGRERWVFDPQLDRGREYSEVTSRGVAAWTDAAIAPGAPAARRLFLDTLDGRLIALDASSGELVPEFGDGGTIDLTQGVGRVEPGEYQVTSPPAVIGDLVIVGSAIGDNRAVESERGVVRAYDARTGEMRWNWDPIPRAPMIPATKPGRARTLMRPEQPMSGRPSPSIRCVISPSFPPLRQARTTTEASAWVRTSSLTVSWRCALQLESPSGTSRRSTTTCGTTTF